MKVRGYIRMEMVITFTPHGLSLYPGLADDDTWRHIMPPYAALQNNRRGIRQLPIALLGFPFYCENGCPIFMNAYACVARKSMQLFIMKMAPPIS